MAQEQHLAVLNQYQTLLQGQKENYQITIDYLNQEIQNFNKNIESSNQLLTKVTADLIILDEMIAALQE